MSHQSLRQAVLPDAGGVEEKLLDQFVSGNAFNALGVTAALGRVLAPSDDVTPGRIRLRWSAIRSGHGAWAAIQRAIGRWIQLEQRPYQIVGVAQAGFTGAQPGTLTDIWIPNMMFEAETFDAPNWNWLQVWGRLAPTVTGDTVQPIALTTLANFEERAGGRRGATQRAAESAIEVRDASTGLSQVRQEFERPLLALAAIVGVVLLIACSNVANLLLARGAARAARDGAARVDWRRPRPAAAAGPGRIKRAHAGGAALGVAVRLAAVPLIVGMLTTNENPVYLDARLDWRVLAVRGRARVLSRRCCSALRLRFGLRRPCRARPRRSATDATRPTPAWRVRSSQRRSGSA